MFHIHAWTTWEQQEIQGYRIVRGVKYDISWIEQTRVCGKCGKMQKEEV